MASHIPEHLHALLPTDPLMAQAWVDCLRWALGESDIMATFQAQTGIVWRAGRTPIERLIDQASGAEEDVVCQFIAWFHANLWGEGPAPRPRKGGRRPAT